MEGFSAEQIIRELAEVVKETDNTAYDTIALRHINFAALALYGIGDWPELIVRDASLTTDDSDDYDLQDTEIVADSTVGRLRGNSVRIGSYYIPKKSIDYINRLDPAKSRSGAVEYYALPNINHFTLWPFGSDGDTVTFDYVSLPTEIEANTTAANMPFEPDRHWLLYEGALWRAMRGIRKPDEWIAQRNFFCNEAKKAFAYSSPAKARPDCVIPSKLG